MAARSLTDAQLQQVYDAVQDCGGNVTLAGERLGLSRSMTEGRWLRARAWAKAKGKHTEFVPAIAPARAPDRISESVTVKGDTCEIAKTTPTRVKTLADLIRVCEIDPLEWEVERYTCNKWEMGSTDVDKHPQTTELYQVKAWMKRKTQTISVRAEIAALLDDAKRKMPSRAAAVRRVRPASNILFEPQIPDLHAGKLAWGDETGWENYDIKTAEDVFDAALDALIVRSKSFGCDRVVVPLGNDLLHSDTKAGTTTGGTPLDNDSRYQKVFATVRRMSVRAIDRLREEVGPVTVVMVPGNHDALSNWHLGDSLECWYRRDKDVTIENSPALRKYYQHGRVMLMHTHGNRGKLDQYPQIMASEQPAMWGATTHREAHTGDKHHQRVLELRGCKVRISPALCPPDAWHSEMTFVGVSRSAEAFVWHPVEGLIGTAFYTVQSGDRVASDAA